jgi:hypothetical protein
MWFVITRNKPSKFYTANGDTLDVQGIEWTNEVVIENSRVFTQIGSSEPFVKDHQQAIALLFKVDIEGFKTKSEAKIFAKTLPLGKWKYLQLTSIEKFVKREMKSE